MSGTASDGSAVSFSGPEGIRTLDSITTTYFRPGIGTPRMPDGLSSYCLAKTYSISANVVISDTDMIIVYDPMTDRSVVGQMYVFASDHWKRLAPLSIAADLTQFAKARSVCGLLRIISNTRSTDSVVLDGNMLTVSFYNFPPTAKFQELSSYLIDPKLGVINTRLSQGQTLVAKPYYHPWEMKFPDTDGLFNIRRDYLNTDPDYIFFNQGWQQNRDFGRCPIYMGTHFFMTVEADCDVEENPYNVTFNVGYAALRGDFTFADPDEHDTFRVATGVNGLHVSFSCAVGTDQPERFLSQCYLSGPQVVRNFVLRIWEANKLFRCNGVAMKYVTYIQGSTGTKNIAISGCNCYELIPKVSNYQQVQFLPPVGSTFVPLEIFNGALANPHCGWRLVWAANGYDQFVQELLFSPDGQNEVIRMADEGLGHASILSALASGWKKGIGLLKNLGINPGAILHKGIDWLSNAGYAASPSTYYAGSASDAANTLPCACATSLCPDGQHSGSFLEDIAAGTLGHASTKEPSSGEGMVEAYDVNLDDDNNIDVEEAAIDQANMQGLAAQDIESSFQASITYAATSTNGVVDAIRRYSAFVIMEQDHKKAAGLGVLSWSRKATEGETYRTVRELVLSMWAKFKDQFPARLNLPVWCDSVKLNEMLYAALNLNFESFKAFICWCCNPALRALTISKTLRGQEAEYRYITLFVPAGVTHIQGTSFLGALYALLLGRDPTMIWEMTSTTMAFGPHLGMAARPVADLPQKLAYIRYFNSAGITEFTTRPFEYAMKSMGLKLTMVVYGSSAEVAEFGKHYHDLKETLITDVEAVGEPVLWHDNVSVIIANTYWTYLVTARSPQVEAILQSLGQSNIGLRIEAYQDESGDWKSRFAVGRNPNKKAKSKAEGVDVPWIPTSKDAFKKALMSAQKVAVWGGQPEKSVRTHYLAALGALQDEADPVSYCKAKNQNPIRVPNSYKEPLKQAYAIGGSPTNANERKVAKTAGAMAMQLLAAVASAFTGAKPKARKGKKTVQQEYTIGGQQLKAHVKQSREERERRAVRRQAENAGSRLVLTNDSAAVALSKALSNTGFGGGGVLARPGNSQVHQVKTSVLEDEEYEAEEEDASEAESGF